MVRSREFSKPRDWMLETKYRFKIWQVTRRPCYRATCQILERLEKVKPESSGFETWRDRAIRHSSVQWIKGHDWWRNKPLPKPMLAYYQLDPREQTSVNQERKTVIFIEENICVKGHFQNVHSFLGLNIKICSMICAKHRTCNPVQSRSWLTHF